MVDLSANLHGLVSGLVVVLLSQKERTTGSSLRAGFLRAQICFFPALFCAAQCAVIRAMPFAIIRGRPRGKLQVVRFLQSSEGKEA